MTRRTTPIGPEILRPTMARPIRELGLKDIRAYLAWCREVGMAPSLEKSLAERVQELEITARRKAAIEAQARLHRNPRRFLAEACAGRENRDAFPSPALRENLISVPVRRLRV